MWTEWAAGGDGELLTRYTPLLPWGCAGDPREMELPSADHCVCECTACSTLQWKHSSLEPVLPTRPSSRNWSIWVHQSVEGLWAPPQGFLLPTKTEWGFKPIRIWFNFLILSGKTCPKTQTYFPHFKCKLHARAHTHTHRLWRIFVREGWRRQCPSSAPLFNFPSPGLIFPENRWKGLREGGDHRDGNGFY